MTRLAVRRVAVLAVFAAASGALADAPAAPRFALPVVCAMGERCAVQNYVDRDPGPGARDYACGTLTYDGHKGTDIGVGDLVAMAESVAVLAAAPGRVRAVRDGMADVDVRDIGRDAVKGREAGNAVIIDHGGGWQTIYGHLRKGSVAVAEGETVAAGQRIGLIGMSGLAEFPHLHFEVRLEGESIDPFVGLGAAPDCGRGAAPLWHATALEALGYRAGGLLGAGFAAAQPDMVRARRGDYRAEALPRDAPALVFWVRVYGVRRGDSEAIRLTAPDGEVLVERFRRLGKDRAEQFGFAGRKRKDALWPAGVYRGEYVLMREVDGARREVLRASREIELR